MTRMRFCEVAIFKRWPGVSALSVCSSILTEETAPCNHTHTNKADIWTMNAHRKTCTRMHRWHIFDDLPGDKLCLITQISCLRKKKYCHAFHAFYVQLLKISAKILAVSPKGVCWIMVNTRELCVQQKTNKTFNIASEEKKTQSHESSCLYMTVEIGSTACFPINPRKQEFMFIVKIN